MKQEILISGTGGQGIVAAGEFLSQALFNKGFEVINSKSYGAEARGGSCRSRIIVSDDKIYDLSLSKTDILIALSIPALKQYQGIIRKGGLILIDKPIIAKIDKNEIRSDIEIVKVNATKIASKLGNVIVANMVLLGALAKRTKIVTIEDLKKAVKEGMRPSMHEVNLTALENGYNES
jgi:2-oxoglutarate ferredoxin oxidoreductase subunit gamma